MSDKASPTRGKNITTGYNTFSHVPRTLSEKPKRKGDVDMTHKSCSKAVPETLTFLLMKEKFEQIYKHIERISLKEEQIAVKIERKEYEISRKELETEIPSLRVNSVQLESKTPSSEQPQISNIASRQKVSLSNVSETIL